MSRSSVLICVFSLSVICAFAKNIDIKSDAEEEEEARFFRKAYTSTVTRTEWVTSLAPSSCIQVDPTLPACRGVRFLNFPQIATSPKSSSNETTNKTNTPSAKEEANVQSTVLSWGEFFGIYAPTVTITATEIQTTIVENPNVVVTFSVVAGCRPSQMPLGIDLCAYEHPQQEIAPSGTGSAAMLQTEVPNLNLNGPQQQVLNALETSNIEIPEEGFVQATDNL